jgi:hypothetical protein
MSAVSSPTNQAEIFARSLGQREPLPSDVAHFFLQLDLSDNDQLRLNELAEKARAGILTANEQQDLDEYRRIGRLVELMKLKAQDALKTG